MVGHADSQRIGSEGMIYSEYGSIVFFGHTDLFYSIVGCFRAKIIVEPNISSVILIVFSHYLLMCLLHLDFHTANNTPHSTELRFGNCVHSLE